MSQLQKYQQHSQDRSKTTRPGNVITYVPQYDVPDDPTADMGGVRKAVYLYTHKLGQEFTLVLLFSLSYQVVVALFVGIRAIRNTPLLNWLPDEPVAYGVVGFIAALIAGFFVQSLLVAELAQVVWLNRTDRLKVRLQRDSIWWWVHLVVLLLVLGLDFLLVFMAVTGTSDLGRAWGKSQNSQLTFVTTAIFVILNVMTLLRCASVMRTSTTEENRREVENRLKTLSDEILLDAGEGTRAQAQEVWKKLSADPSRFLPLSDAVLNYIRRQHPEFFPPELGGDTWGYDVNSHTFSALPPDVHLALTQGRGRADRFPDEDQRRLWSLGPSDLADLIGFNIENQGRPRFVDLSDPTEPQYVYNPANLQALATPPSERKFLDSESGSSEQKTPVVAPASHGAPNPATTPFADTQSFLVALPDLEKVLFAGYLKNTVFPGVYKRAWTEETGVSVWNIFDVVDLQYFYRLWKKTVSNKS